MALFAVGSTLKESATMILEPPQDMDPTYTTLLEKWPLQDITNSYSFHAVVGEGYETASFISNGRYNDENSNGRSTRKARLQAMVAGPGARNVVQGRGDILRKGFR